MTDLLTRAWNLLEPGERPEGMSRYPRGPNGYFSHDLDCGTHVGMPLAAARDRLTVAVEGVLLERAKHRKNNSWHHWGDTDCDGAWEDIAEPHDDRLHAAVLALEAERGTR